MRDIYTIRLFTALMLASAGCAEAPDAEEASGQAAGLVAPLPFEARPVMIEPADADPDVFPGMYMADAAAVERFFAAGGRIVEASRPFQQINWFYDATSDAAPRYRVRWASGAWSAWREAEVTWAEGAMHNARALLEAPAVEVEIARIEGLSLANIELPGRQLVDPKAPLTHTLPRVRDALPVLRGDSDAIRTVAQGIAPASLVVPRSEWGARDPNKICGEVVAPYRLTIHHTAVPDTDGSDINVRLRQMQAYHIDNNGWCDIGYHFIVSQAGKIYQGRSDERRPGAHTGNQNNGNIGVSLIGNYEANPLIEVQIDAAIRILSWIKQTYPGIGWSRTNIKGHKEWPGQSTACPGKNFMARFDAIVDEAGGATPQPMEYEVDVSVRYVGDAVRDFHAQGKSEGVGDVLPGDKFQAEIVVRNGSSQPLRGVKLDYMIDAPYIQARGYTIQTDHPAKDGNTWALNDADAAPENPAKDSLGEGGTLSLYAFGAGESKRVLIELEAVQYSIGKIDHPDVRGWVRHIDDVYGEQTAWDEAPAVNKLKDSPKLQGFVELDVLASDRWSFDGGSPTDFEGWADCAPGQAEALTNNVMAGGTLSQRIKGADACVAAPAWTSIDADRWDQLVMRVRANDGPHRRALYWAPVGEPFAEARSVRFEAKGDKTFETLVVPMGEHPLWTGEVVNLRLDLLDGAAPGAGASAWYDVDALHLQSAASGETNAVGVAFEQRRPVALLPPGAGPGPGEEPGEEPGEGPGAPEEGERPPGVSTNDSSCAAAGVVSSGAGGAVSPLWLLGLAALWRRRRGASARR